MSEIYKNPFCHLGLTLFKLMTFVSFFLFLLLDQTEKKKKKMKEGRDVGDWG